MPALSIRRLGPPAGADLDGYQEMYAAAELAEDPEARLVPRSETAALLASTDTASFFHVFGTFRDGRVLGGSILTGSNRDNLQVAQLLLWVHPSHVRSGVGSALLKHTEQHAASLGRTVLRVQTRFGPGLEGNRRFAEHHGYVLALTEVESRLSLPVDRAVVDRLAAEAAPYHRDYEIRTAVGQVPAELRASYVDVDVDNLLLVEMPHGDLDLETGRQTVHDLDARDRDLALAGQTMVRAFAVRDGRVTGFSDASVPGGDARHIDQYGTLVHPHHRGHRLGLAVKCAQLRVLQEQFPGRTYVRTNNAESNTRMIAVNEALGFARHQVWGELEKRLRSAEG